MSTILTIARLTFHEAWRRRMVVLALVMGAIFILLYNIGVALIIRDVLDENPPEIVRQQVPHFLLLAGLYVVHFLAVMLAIFASVDTISGEIGSHTIQTLITKPVRRWEVLFGKWLGCAAMLMLYLLLLGSGVLGASYLHARYIPANALQGLSLLMLEALVLISLSMLLGTRLSTLTNGVALFMVYGLAFIGTWVEQIGSLLESEAAVRVGIVTSLLMPVESLWRRAAHVMQPSGLGLTGFISPFSAFAPPSAAMVGYGAVYASVALLLAMRSFNRRDL